MTKHSDQNFMSLGELGAPSHLILGHWTSSQKQYVRTSLETSTVLHVITGARQGCVVHPVLGVLFVDNSSVFNTIYPHLLINKLNELGVPSHLILGHWTSSQTRSSTLEHHWKHQQSSM